MTRALTNPPSTLRLQNSAQVQRFADAVVARSARWTRLVVAVPDFSHSANARLENRISSLYTACGCTAAAAVGFLGLAGSVTWSIITHGGSWEVLDFAVPCMAFVVGVVVGKLGGKAAARRMLLRELRELSATLEVSAQHGSVARGTPPDQVSGLGSQIV